MKRFFALLHALLFVCALTACAAAPASGTPAATPQPMAPKSQPASDSVPAPSSASSAGQPRVLVAFFSATGNTGEVARTLQAVLDADLFAIVPQEPYTEADLNYSDDACRANQEQNDPQARPAIAGTPEDAGQYDVVFLGYPIWWGQAPKVIYTFLESCDFGDAVIVPFCTSGSSGIGSSAEPLQALAENARWLEGQRFAAGADEEEIAAWVDGLDL